MDIPYKKFLKLSSVFTIITIVLGLATQNLAKLVKYSHALGEPMYKHIYNPYSIILWTIKYNTQLPNALNKALLYPSLILTFFSIIIFIRILKKDNQKDIKGSARWIKPKELEKLGYLVPKHSGNDGVILGRIKTSFGDKTIIDNDNTHISVIAPTRSGKGVGIIIPTLLNWKHSTLVLDPKGENFALTSGYRQKVLKHKILKFAPFSDKDGVSYNPLSGVRIQTIYESKDVNVITSILVDNGKDAELDHWAASAKTLLNGVIFHVLYITEGRSASLGDVVDFLTDPSMLLEDKLRAIIGGEDQKKPKYNHQGNYKNFKEIYDEPMMRGVPKKVHPIVARMCAEFLGKDEKERASVVSTAITKISLFKDPIIRKNTTNVDFRIGDLMNHKNPIDLYIVIQPEDIKLLSPFIRLVITQIIGTLCPEMDYEKSRTVHTHRMLLLLDEFPAFGKIPILEKALAYIAGYGMKAMLIGQSLSQFKQIYGKGSSVLDNCATSVFYTPSPNDSETPKIISNMLGKKTIKVQNTTTKEGQLFGGSTSSNYQARELLTEEEVRNKLGDQRNIIALAGKYPVMGWKIKFYEEPYFTGKTNSHYGIPKSDTIDQTTRS
jgi:type IV secretion system protein VirD4